MSTQREERRINSVSPTAASARLPSAYDSSCRKEIVTIEFVL